jgi:two-component system LytT family response regulator
MNVLIIDDEKNSAEVLQLLIGQNCNDVTIIAVEHSAEEGINSILNLKPDLVFLDIEMPTATGFDVIKATQSIHYEIIFTTAYEHYAVKAFKANAVDYLLKPIDVDELMSAIKNAQLRMETKNTNNVNTAQFESLLKKMGFSTKKISIPTNRGVILVEADEIIHLVSDSNYTTVFLNGGRKILISKTLKSMEEQLKDYNFCRVHNTYLVNINKVESYIKGDGGTLILKDNFSIPVSRAHKQKLLDKIGLH